MPNDRVSVLTIAAGRPAHLANTIRGLAAQHRTPDEMVVAVMQSDLYDDLPETPFPVRQVRVRGEGLPLSAARNLAAAEAVGDTLIFLDVDCVPHPDLCGDYARAVSDRPGLFMGEVLYLPEGASDGLDFDAFDRVAVKHEDRRGPPVGRYDACGDYRCFWSLNFAIGRSDWNRSGGFDVAFTGYGGEDTDFGRTVAERGIPIWWLRGARAYHQFHPHMMPPVHHVGSILHNTRVFAGKWGHRTMEHWLRAFRLMGLIEEGPDGLRQVREPSPAELDLCRQRPGQAYASSRRVLEQLEARPEAAE